MALFYAGVGSRKTPPDVLTLMKRLAYALAFEGWTLRSGGADGADRAFADGAAGACADMPRRPTHPTAMIYVPWSGFNGLFTHDPGVWEAAHLGRWAQDIAAVHHPRWADLTPAVRKMHTRNVAQVLGPGEGAQRSAFVLCWTPDGCQDGQTTAATGGTGQALRIAAAFGIPIRNLAVPSTRRAAEAWLYPNRWH